MRIRDRINKSIKNFKLTAKEKKTDNNQTENFMKNKVLKLNLMKTKKKKKKDNLATVTKYKEKNLQKLNKKKK